MIDLGGESGILLQNGRSAPESGRRLPESAIWAGGRGERGFGERCLGERDGCGRDDPVGAEALPPMLATVVRGG